MKILLTIAFSFLLAQHAHAQLETDLIRDIQVWRKGDAPPARLLKFPDGKIDTVWGCGLRAFGSEVGDYIWKIQDTDLLAALIFDPRAQPETFHAAVSRLITLNGIGHISRILAERRKTDPDSFKRRSELAVLSQLLRSPYITLQVASIDYKDMPQDKAENALQAMKDDLQAGVAWADVYTKYSDLHPDMRDREKDPRSVRTLICYLYDSTVSPNGFDIVSYRIAKSLHIEHLNELFRARKGTHLLKAADGVYLYNIVSFYDGSE